MAPRKRNPEKTRAALLKAAGEILAEKGLSGFHVHDIAARAGYGKPLVYRYFGDRGQVLDALAEAKAAEVETALSGIKAPETGKVSPRVYRQIMFARVLAGDALLRALYRAQLSGELGGEAGLALNKIIPHSGKGGDAGAAEAFLLAGISYILLLRDSMEVCNGVPIETPNHLAAFERAFIGLATKA